MLTKNSTRRVFRTLRLFGRRRLVSEIDPQGRDRGFVKRAAINAPLQGSAADLIKRAMIQLHQKIESEKRPLQMVLQIHDELLFEIPKDYDQGDVDFVRSEMENVVDLSVPLVVEVAVGSSWEEAH